MTLTIAHLQPIVSLIAGILILIMPQPLNYRIWNTRPRVGSLMQRRDEVLASGDTFMSSGRFGDTAKATSMGTAFAGVIGLIWSFYAAWADDERDVG